jgi:hypothetical protein
MLFPFISLASPNVPWCDDQRVLEEWVRLQECGGWMPINRVTSAVQVEDD